MQLPLRALNDLSELICGASGSDGGFKHPNFPYRSSSRLTRFFLNCDMEHEHQSSITRQVWVLEILKNLNAGEASIPQLPPDGIVRVIQELMSAENFQTDNLDRGMALAQLNECLERAGLQAYFDGANRCHLRKFNTQVTSATFQLQRRAWTEAELERRKAITGFLEKASEDAFIEEILQPLFQQLGFTRVTVTGHKDKHLEYGKDIWMKYQLPTSHYLYFGVQAKRTKIDSTGTSKSNVGEILNQITMMLGHEIFDPETNKKVLVDHVFIISAAVITKQAKNWLGEHLDRVARRSIMFMDQDDLLNLAVTTNLKVPGTISSDEVAF